MRAVDGLNWLRGAAARQDPPREPTCRCPERSSDGHRVRGRLVPYPGTDAPVLDATSTSAARRRDRRARRRERRRQDDARQAARPLLRADGRRDHGRRRGHPPLRPRGVARRTRGRLPGLRRFELLARESVGVGDLPRSSTGAGGRGRARPRRTRATSSRRCRDGPGDAARASLRRRRASCPAASGRSSRSAGR